MCDREPNLSKNPHHPTAGSGGRTSNDLALSGINPLKCKSTLLLPPLFYLTYLQVFRNLLPNQSTPTAGVTVEYRHLDDRQRRCFASAHPRNSSHIKPTRCHRYNRRSHLRNGRIHQSPKPATLGQPELLLWQTRVHQPPGLGGV